MNPSGIIFKCPLEECIEQALIRAGIPFKRETPERLDFYLPNEDLFIEVKSGHSPRISDQMSRARNVIAVQGQKSVRFLARLIESGQLGPVNTIEGPLVEDNEEI